MMAGNKLKYCLESLVHQTIDDYEIIAVNDASTDDSYELLKKYDTIYGEKFHAVNLPRNMRQGGAKNAGLDLAKGDYIGFVDSDDWIASDMYERLLRKAEETGADMVGCDYCLTDHQGVDMGTRVENNRVSQSGVLDDEKYKSLILDSGSLVVKIYKRSMFEAPRLRFPERMFYEDNAVATDLMLRAKHFEYIPECMYYYYQHSASTVHSFSKEKCMDRLKAMDLMLTAAKHDGHLEKYRDEICFRYTNLAYMNTLFTYMFGDQPKELAFIRMLGKRMKQAFPDFQENPYYLKRATKEERKLMGLQQKSTLLFVLYFKLLYFVRNLRKKRKTTA